MIDGYEKHTCTECETMFTSNEELQQHHTIDHGLIIENSIEWTDVQPEQKVEETDDGFTADGKTVTFSDEDKPIAESYLTETANLQRIMVASEQRLKLARDEIKASEADTNAFYEQFLGESNGQDFSSGAGTINPLDTPKFKYSKNNKLADTINTKGYVPNPNAGLYDNKEFKEGGNHLEDPLAKEDFEVSFYGGEAKASEEDYGYWNNINTPNLHSGSFNSFLREIGEYDRWATMTENEKIYITQFSDKVDAGQATVSDYKPYSFESKASEVSIDDFKRIVDRHQNETLQFDDGEVIVDAFTANALVQVYNALSEEQKQTFNDIVKTSGGVSKVADLAFKASEYDDDSRDERIQHIMTPNDPVTKEEAELLLYGTTDGSKGKTWTGNVSYDEEGNVISNEFKFGEYEVKCDCDKDPDCETCGGKGTNTWSSTVGKSDESLKADWDESDYEEKYSWLKDLGVEDAFKYANMTLYELPEPVWKVVNEDYVQGFKQMIGESYKPDQKNTVETAEEKIISRKLDGTPVGQIARELVLWDNMSEDEAEKMVSETEPSDNDMSAKSLFNKKYSELNENELAEMELYDV